ncbi:MAG: cell division protein SepF [Ruminococcus sp.]|nr:cell division protein SepF [Ruminococcus sp.]
MRENDGYSSGYSRRSGRNTERESDIRMATTDQSSFDLVLARPNNFKEVEKIGNDINCGRTVILNLELVKQEDATRILDFIWGVAFANDDEIKMMAQKTYAIIPRNVNFSGVDLVSELENNGYSF